MAPKVKTLPLPEEQVVTGRFSEVYGRIRVAFTQDDLLNDLLLHQALSEALLLKVEYAKEHVIETLRSAGGAVLSLAPHPHNTEACLMCACAPYLSNNRKHAVEMTVLNDLLDRRGQSEDRILDLPNKLLRNRIRSHEFTEKDLIDLYGPHWVNVMVMAYILEETNPRQLIGFISKSRELPELEPKHHDGRDYRHAAVRLLKSATMAPHDIAPVVLPADPRVSAQIRTASKNRKKALDAAWGHLAELTSCGYDPVSALESLSAPAFPLPSKSVAA